MQTNKTSSHVGKEVVMLFRGVGDYSAAAAST